MMRLNKMDIFQLILDWIVKIAIVGIGGFIVVKIILGLVKQLAPIEADDNTEEEEDLK